MVFLYISVLPLIENLMSHQKTTSFTTASFFLVFEGVLN